jgi:phosphoadenosine phosphosulfate reductase
MVLLDLVQQIDPGVNVFVADTELLFPETYALIERVERRYGISVERVRPGLTVAEQERAHGPALWASDPDACCDIRKVQPLREHLRSYDAWMTAIRRDQARTRSTTAVRSWDTTSQIVKVAPLADWSDDDLMTYASEHDIAINTLHYDGYPSIGCTHCTKRVAPGDDARAGRWPGFDKVECGIHVA